MSWPQEGLPLAIPTLQIPFNTPQYTPPRDSQYSRLASFHQLLSPAFVPGIMSPQSITSHSPCPPSSSSNQAFTPLGLPIRKNVVIKLPDESKAARLWVRQAAQTQDFGPFLPDRDLLCVSREPHYDEIQKELPPSIDIYLPGYSVWAELIEELETRRRGHSPRLELEPYKSVPADLLATKLSDLQLAMSSAPQSAFLPPPSLLLPFQARSPSQYSQSSSLPEEAFPLPPFSTQIQNNHARLNPNALPFFAPQDPVARQVTKLNPNAASFAFEMHATTIERESVSSSQDFQYPLNVNTQLPSAVSQFRSERAVDAENYHLGPNVDDRRSSTHSSATALSDEDKCETPNHSHSRHVPLSSSSKEEQATHSKSDSLSRLNADAKPFTFERRTTFGNTKETVEEIKHRPNLSQIWTLGETDNPNTSNTSAQVTASLKDRMRRFRFPSPETARTDGEIAFAETAPARAKALAACQIVNPGDDAVPIRSDHRYATIGRHGLRPTGLTDMFENPTSLSQPDSLTDTFAPSKDARKPLPGYVEKQSRPPMHDREASLDDIALPTLSRGSSKAILLTSKKSDRKSRYSSEPASSLHLTDLENDRGDSSDAGTDQLDATLSWKSFEALLEVKLNALKEALTGSQAPKAKHNPLEADALLNSLLSKLGEQLSIPHPSIGGLQSSLDVMRDRIDSCLEEICAASSQRSDVLAALHDHGQESTAAFRQLGATLAQHSSSIDASKLETLMAAQQEAWLANLRQLISEQSDLQSKAVHDYLIAAVNQATNSSMIQQKNLTMRFDQISEGHSSLERLLNSQHESLHASLIQLVEQLSLIRKMLAVEKQEDGLVIVQQENKALKAQILRLQSVIETGRQAREVTLLEAKENAVQLVHSEQEIVRLKNEMNTLVSDMDEMERDLVELKVSVAKELQDASTRLSISEARLSDSQEENRLLQRIVNFYNFPIDMNDYPDCYADIYSEDVSISTQSSDEQSSGNSALMSKSTSASSATDYQPSLGKDGWWQ